MVIASEYYIGRISVSKELSNSNTRGIGITDLSLETYFKAGVLGFLIAVGSVSSLGDMVRP